MPKYEPDTSHWDEDDEPEQPAHSDVRVGHHWLQIYDEREAVEPYNGLVWQPIIEDGTITAVDLSHYCPGPGHTDIIGFRAWEDVPEPVQRAILDALNGTEEELVDVEACREVVR